MKPIPTLIFLLACRAAAAETNVSFRIDLPRWAPSFRGGAAHHLETDLGKGGSFSANRYFIEAGITRMWALDRMVSFSVGYGQDDYHFSGTPTQPWSAIDNYRAGLFARWGLNDRWVLFAGPSLRSYGASGVDLEDAATWAFFGGASYRFNDHLTLGPGLGVFDQLGDSARYVPILIVKWDITEAWTLETGGGLAATAGPGLSLSYQIADRWTAALAARYEKKRFLLTNAGSIGEDRSIQTTASISHQLYPAGTISLGFGAGMDGHLSSETKYGQETHADSYKNSPSIAITTSLRF